jgi:hypothetical protein
MENKMDIGKRLENIEKRLAILEDDHGLCGETGNKTIELDLVLPQADIGGLHFNEQKVHAGFEEQDDGWYYSRDILFLSARNIKDDNSRDILAEYLNSYSFKNCIRQQLPEEIFGVVMHADKIEVSLAKENKGIKKYNGVNWQYWLQNPHGCKGEYFHSVGVLGATVSDYVFAVLGCAPAFRVV